MKYSRKMIELFRDFDATMNLDDRFVGHTRTLSQVDILINIEALAKGEWHEDYKKGFYPDNFERDTKTVTINSIKRTLELLQLHTPQDVDTIATLQDTLEHLEDNWSTAVLKRKDILDYRTNEASRWLELVEYSPTKIKELLPIIKSMIKNGF